ncbi:MAG TPA: hypothetical protein VFB20_14890 [Burkholderiales bacterium]|nr:hypothetical protein [Burkholderiales bacterium]
MATIKVAVINASTVVADDQVKATVPVLQTQVSRDFAAAWGIDAELRFVPKGSKPAAAEWWLVVLEDSDQAGALGYHDLTQQGLPLGKVFAKTDQAFGEQWTVTASHELLEMLADPDINLTVFVESGSGGRLYAYEVCDACEADQNGYKIDGVLVSDFVYPAWFESFRTSATQFDQTKKVGKPFELLKGGYIGVYDVRSGSGWTQLTAEKINFRARPPVGSRRERRGIPIDRRIRSTAFSR